ncbi:hypothetical protein OB920_13195 [Halobacteria archaeon HArc-gm2]|nr:hypothetical protein [Halobacteria archaeon HArc-gm2]
MVDEPPLQHIIQAAEYMGVLETEFDITAPEEKEAVAMFYLGDQLSRIADSMEDN